MHTRLARSLAWALAASCALAVFAQLYACLSTRDARRTPMPANYGNFERVRATLPAADPDKPFTFAVVGDPRSSGTFERLAGSITATRPAFIVILGDWVSDGTPDDHAHFRQEAADYGFASPVFFTPGNHDVDPDTYPLQHFEADYGPRNFSFEYGGNLFILISHLDKRFSNEESLNYLRSLDKNRLQKYRRRFVLMHIPPWVSPDIQERHTADENELVGIFKEMGIDYVIAADFHGYNRTSRDGIEYVVTGGGGGKLHEATGRQFHHAIAITVDANMVSEKILPAPAGFEFGASLERNAVTRFGPFLFRHPYLALAWNACAVGMAWLALHATRRRRPGQ